MEINDKQAGAGVTRSGQQSSKFIVSRVSEYLWQRIDQSITRYRKSPKTSTSGELFRLYVCFAAFLLGLKAAFNSNFACCEIIFGFLCMSRNFVLLCQWRCVALQCVAKEEIMFSAFKQCSFSVGSTSPGANSLSDQLPFCVISLDEEDWIFWLQTSSRSLSVSYNQVAFID